MKIEDPFIACTDLIDDSVMICDGVDVSNAPSEIIVLSEGSYQTRPGGKVNPMIIAASDIDACALHFKARRERNPGRDIVVDYEHQTLGDGEAPAAGWINDVNAIMHNGKKVLTATVSTWTDRAKKYIENKEYRYVSPVFALKAMDKETGKIEPCILKNVALTNEPFLDNLAPIISKNISQTNPGKDTSMDNLLKSVRQFLGLPDTATAEEATSGLSDIISKLKEAVSPKGETVTAKDVLGWITGAAAAITEKVNLVKDICAKDGGTIEEARVTFIAAKEAQTQLIAAKDEVKVLKQKDFDRSFGDIIAKAFHAGKILPTQKANEGWMKSQKDFAAADIAAFDKFWDTQPVVGPVQPLPTSGGEPITAKGITEDDKVMAKKLGVSEESLVKHNKVE